MRITLTVLACAALAACTPELPESGAGFNSYDEYIAEKRAREAALTGSSLPPAQTVSTQPLTTTTHSNDADALAADTRATLSQTAGTPTAAGTSTTTETPTATGINTQTVTSAGGISSENDFDAVGAERTIEDDAALIAQNRAQYKVVEATALPQRTGGEGPNIVQYALSTTHPAGTSIYKRSGFNQKARYQRNCSKFASAEEAQMAFLAGGGPDRDRKGLDPDGDGYACGWDPAPFRKATVAATPQEIPTEASGT